MWFDTWTDILRVLSVGAAAYVTLVAVLRMSGKRTLAQLNAFDLVVTVAVGSTLATILLNADVSFTEGMAALVLLTLLQFIAAVITSRLRLGRAVVTSRPTVLLWEGKIRDGAARRERVSTEDIRQAARASGIGDVSRIGAVVLETDGSLSVIAAEEVGNGSALDGLRHEDGSETLK
jgi:uncharacterized membrane protein YcaP (DUF421 family)